VIYFFGYDNESRADVDMIKALLFILAATVASVAVILLVTHRINVKQYKKLR